MARPPIRNLTKAQREVLALEWAQRRGYPVPKKPLGGLLVVFLVVVGLLFAVVPGLIILGFLYLAHRDYDKQKADLVMRWADWYERRGYDR